MSELRHDPQSAPQPNLDVLKFQLERSRYRADLLKWIVVAIGAVASFWVIDVGKLQLERFRATSDNQRQLLDAYLKATETVQPDVWKRKLRVLVTSATDEQMKQWAKAELQDIENFAAIDALYRETLKVAAQLVEPSQINEPERARARVRYNQLFWADLPFAGESPAVVQAMIAFRKQLMTAEQEPKDRTQWEELNRALITLSEALRDSMPKYSSPGAPTKRGG
jgi:hypothetical protein